jgi:hypothetical protein
MTYLPATKQSDLFSTGPRSFQSSLPRPGRLMASTHVPHTTYSDVTLFSNDVNYALTASFLDISGSIYTDLNALFLVGGGVTGSIFTGNNRFCPNKLRKFGPLDSIYI